MTAHPDMAGFRHGRRFGQLPGDNKHNEGYATIDQR